MILKNGKVLTDDFHLTNTDIGFTGSKIDFLGNYSGDQEFLDVSGMYVLPGFVDTHIHGAYGVRFSDIEPDIDRITGFLAKKGVTTLVATTGSSRFDDLLLQFEGIVKAINNGTKGAKIAGIHAEGPFLNKKYKGAMSENNILAPDLDKLNRIVDECQGYLKIMTIAPEMENADDLIRYLKSEGVIISLGHTDATYEQAEKSAALGASQATHVFNAMRPFNHREPGVLGCVLTNKDVKCEMICDFVHLHPNTVKMIYTLKGADNINLISDAGHSAGLEMDKFLVDGVWRYVVDGVVRLEDGTIAGSTMTMAEGVLHLFQMGIPPEEISKMASLNPAVTLGLADKIGTLTIGKSADIVVLDKNFNLVHTFVEGERYL